MTDDSERSVEEGEYMQNRTTNTLKNLFFGYTEELIIVILSFITRRIFVQELGEQFTGLNSVISNILSMLNLVELGFGSAIIYSLYKPLAQKDEAHIKALMGFYRSTYRIFGTIITVVGLCLMPVLPFLFKDDVSFVNIYFVFALHLLQTVSTYLFFAYKRSILEADQKAHLISKIRTVFMFLVYLAQIASLIWLKNYYAYLIITIAGTILQNVVIAFFSDREYPFIHGKALALDVSEREEIKSNCKALFIYRINSYVLNSTDSLILANFVSLNLIGFYGHYLTLVNAMKSIVNKLFTSMVGSLGNLHAEAQLSDNGKNRFDHEERVFSIINLISFAAYGLFSVGIFAASSNFIDIWIGPGQTLSQTAVFFVAIECYIYGLTKPTASFRASMGLFQQCKYRPIASMVLNLIISLATVYWWGIEGVLFGTVASVALTTVWYDPVIIYRDGFHRSVKPYFGKILRFTVVECLSIVICALFQYFVKLEGFAAFIVNGFLAVAVFVTLFVIILHTLPEFMELITLVKSIISGIGRKLKR